MHTLDADPLTKGTEMETELPASSKRFVRCSAQRTPLHGSISSIDMRSNLLALGRTSPIAKASDCSSLTAVACAPRALATQSSFWRATPNRSAHAPYPLPDHSRARSLLGGTRVTNDPDWTMP